ncbi:MAG TPA: type 1 glutamine amidotransferase [Thermoleophilaceae bacterium]|nr:type 1 glutamine amidotransferase [Thermoleophilaceae bacterium]
MRVLAIVHQSDAGAGVFGEVVHESGHELVEWVPVDAGPQPPVRADAAMVFGGAVHVDQEGANPWMRGEKAVLRELLADGVPLLGVCLGAQLVADAAGGAPRRAREPEIGWIEIELTPEARSDPLLGPLPERLEVFAWHSYEARPPDGAVALAHSPVCLQAYRLDGSRAWGIQFHAEVMSRELNAWLDSYEEDEEAVRIGLDPERLRAESAGRLEEWNELGRGIARRFLEEAARRPVTLA